VLEALSSGEQACSGEVSAVISCTLARRPRLHSVVHLEPQHMWLDGPCGVTNAGTAMRPLKGAQVTQRGPLSMAPKELSDANLHRCASGPDECSREALER
jgi:hypothetical protein